MKCLLKICYICQKEFCIDEKDKEYMAKRKVKDLGHYTGKFIGAAHSSYNLRYKIPKEIHVVLHNGSTYDYHFIIEEVIK